MKLFLLLLTILTLQASTEFEEAYVIYKQGDFKTSKEKFYILASTQNDADAAYILAYMYEHGEGCNINKELAATWYKKSSHSYYYQIKYQPTRELDKEQKKLYKSLNRSKNSLTQDTIRQYTQSLYSIKAHKANYFLPLSYRTNGTYADTNNHKAKGIETEFQISLKYNFASNLFSLDEIYTVAYTQKAFWQVYAKSAYFRETNYNPELFVTFPMQNIKISPYLKALRFSFAHQSNGRGGEEERSWNYLSISTYFQYKLLFSELKLWHRTQDNIDYNPELIDYIGYGHIEFILPYKKHIAKLLLRSNFSGESAFEFNYSYPLFGSADSFFYLKAFSGYGESLIDYNHKIDKLGFGLSISR